MSLFNRIRPIDLVMVGCVLLAVADQVSDVLFAVRAFQPEWFAGASAAFFVALFPCVLAFQLWSAGEGIDAVLRALLGLELLWRTWQALISVAKRRSSEDAWKPVSALFSLESMLEGAPLILLTSAWLHRASLSRCWHMNCDPVALKGTFPASVLPHFDSTERFKSEYAAAMQTQPGCTYHPMSSDGWFTAHTKLRSGEFLKWKPLGKPMAFRLEGVRDIEGRALSNGTFACVAVLPPRFNMWLAWLEPAIRGSNTNGTGMQSGETIAALSLAIGLVSLVTNQFLAATTVTETSLWALEPLAALPSPAALKMSIESWRRNVHIVVVGLFTLVDVFASATLYFELVVTFVWIEPHSVLTLAVIPYMILACAVKTTIVAGWQQSQWLQGFPWFMWAVVPQLAKAKWALRRGAWCCRWLAFLVVLSERCALIVGLTALSRLFPRADHVLWVSMWPRLTVLWALFGGEVALIGVATWTKAQADAVTLELRPQENAPHRNTADRSVAPAGLAERAYAQCLAQPQLSGGRGAVAPLPSDPCAEGRKESLLEENDPDAHAR